MEERKPKKYVPHKQEVLEARRLGLTYPEAGIPDEEAIAKYLGLDRNNINSLSKMQRGKKRTSEKEDGES